MEDRVMDALDRLHANAEYNGCLLDFRTVKQALTPQSSADLGRARRALEMAHNDYRSAYDVQAEKSFILETRSERTAAGIRCDSVLMPKIVMFKEAIELLDQMGRQAAPETTHLFNGKVYSRRQMEAENTKMREDIAALRAKVEGMKRGQKRPDGDSWTMIEREIKNPAHNAAITEVLRLIDGEGV
jgi:hypothetical protein